MVILGVAALVVGGGTGAFVTKNVTSDEVKTDTTTVTEMKTVTVPADGETETEDVLASVGLEELGEEEDVGFDVSATFENRTIGRNTYADAVMVEVYPDSSLALPIQTKGRFSTMHFVVGIDAEAECPRSEATVSVEDQDGRVLWGPRTATISKPITETIPISRPLQVMLVQHTNETESSCDGGWTQVSWGDVNFQTG